MPRLSSGRHVCLTLDPLQNGLVTGSDERKYFAIMVYRLEVPNPAALRPYLDVGYYDGEPPGAKAYRSPWSVKDVLEGRSDWSPHEVDEFRHWLDTNPAIEPWLQEQFDAIDETIRNDSLWTSDLILGD